MNDYKDIEKEAVRRLQDARQQKQAIEADLREAYFFTSPQRQRDVSSQTLTRTAARETDAAELQISTAIELSQDFATEVLNAFTPETMSWADQKPGVDMDNDSWGDIREEVDAQTGKVMSAIKSSGFYAAASMAYLPDLALGTIGMFIDDLRAAEPIVCMPVPIKEIELNIGPYGDVDDRFIVRNTRYGKISALLNGVQLPDDIKRKIKDCPNHACTVTWGWWRDWEADDLTWFSVIMVNKSVVQKGKLVGEGSCPFIVGRFNPDVMFPFGHGPTLQSLPDLRRLDETEALKVDAADFKIHRPFIYADDGVMNFANGVEPGMGYPARSWGAGRPIEPLMFDSDVRFGEFETARIEQRIRRLHFADYPEQIGKTPPTAEQWLDEMARTKKRIGTPGKVFFREFPAEVFLRFKFLLEKRGVIKKIEVNGKTITLVPYDPTEQAQEHAEVNIANRILEMARTHFPQTAQVAIDETATLQNIIDKLRDKIVVLRDPEQMKQTIAQLAPILGGGGGGADPAAAPGAMPGGPVA